MATTPMTRHGSELLKDELHRLKSVERPAVITSIADACAQGDLSENAEYESAKERQGFIEGRIAELESKLAAAQVIDQPAQRDRPQPSPSLAGLGAIVAGAAPHRDEGVLQRRVDHVGIGAAVVQAHQQPACMPVVQRLERASVAACDRGQQLGVGAQRRGHGHQRGSSRTHAVDACRRACRPCRHRRQSARAPRIGKASCCRMPSGIGPGMP